MYFPCLRYMCTKREGLPHDEGVCCATTPISRKWDVWREKTRGFSWRIRKPILSGPVRFGNMADPGLGPSTCLCQNV